MKPIFIIHNYRILVSYSWTSQCLNKILGAHTPPCFIRVQVNAQPYLKQLWVRDSSHWVFTFYFNLKQGTVRA